MSTFSGFQLLFLLVPLLLWSVGLVLYGVIRLAVRHGVLDAQRRGAAGVPEGR